MPQTQKRNLYNGAYRSTINDPDNSTDGPTPPDGETGNTPDTDPDTPEERSWKNRYGDLRSHSNTLTERVKQLESQLVAAQKKEIRIPSTQEELSAFAKQYPDVYRNILSIARIEALQERENISQETQSAKEKLEKMERELGEKKILLAHPDFDAINASREFHEWATVQPLQIQEWLFESTNPDLCIKALDLYKAETDYKKRTNKKPNVGADVAVRSRTPIEVSEEGGKKVWKASEIQKMHPKLYEKHEEEIELARLEGRLDINS